MARISRVLRRVSKKTRGVPLEHVLAAVAFLVGAGGGWLLWAAVLGDFVSYRAEMPMRAVVQGREEEAVARVCDLVKGKLFQKLWLQEANQFGLVGARRLEVLEPQSDGSFRLRCSGRPLWQVRASLGAACKRLTDPKETSLELLPIGYEGKHAGLEAEIGNLEAEVNKKKPDAPPANEGAAFEELRARLSVAEEELKSARRRCEAAGNEEQLAAQIRDLDKEIAAAPRTAVSPAERARLTAERDRLQRLLAHVDREDCSENHPLVKRLDRIEADLRAAALPERRAGLERQKAEAQRLQKLLVEKETVYKEARRKHDEAGDDLKKIREQRDKADSEYRKAFSRLEDKKKEKDDLEKQAHFAVEISTQASGPGVETRGSWLGWICVLFGLGLGTFLAATAYRYAALRLSVIDDESVLADKLHVPVLGSVPRMAALAKH